MIISTNKALNIDIKNNLTLMLRFCYSSTNIWICPGIVVPDLVY